MNNENKRRGWVKDVAIIFLVIMLILTFFSRTIMNMSLPEVSGQYATYGNIAASVRGTGTVQTNMAYGVQISQTRQIKEILVRKGQDVEAGDTLILLEDDESEELTRAREELSTLRYSYRELLLNSKDVDSEDSLEIKNLREDIDKAYAKLESIDGDDSTLVTAKAAVKSLQAEIKAIEKSITATNERISEARDRINEINSDKSGVASAQKAYDNAVRDIAYAEEDLAIMKSDLEARNAAQGVVDKAKDALDSAQEALETAEEEFQTAERDFSAYSNVTDKTIAEARNEMLKAQEKADEYKERFETLSRRRINYQEAEQNYLDAKEEYELLLKDDSATEEEIASAKAHRDNMYESFKKKTKVTEEEVDNAQDYYERYENDAFRLQVEYETLVKEQEGFDDDPLYVEAKKKYDAAKTAYDNAKAAHKSAQEAYEDATEARDEIPSVSKSSISEAERSLTRRKTDLTYLEKDYKDAVEAFTGKPYTEGFSIDAAVESGLSEARAELSSAETELENLEVGLEAKKEELERAEDDYNDALEEVPEDADELRRSISSMERQLEALLEAQEDSRESQVIADEKHKLELEKASAAITKQEAKVAELEENTIDAKVTARYAGTITSISVIAGDTANAGEELMGIDVSGKGYTMTIPVTLEQSRYVKVGDTAKILNYWGSGITVKLAEIKNDRGNQSGRILEFDVDGDVTDGQSLNISVGERQSYYDYVVPNSAVREDANGTFIYIAEVKATPIGNRFTARRLPVTVIVKDERSSALDIGEGYNNEFVIVNSSTPLTDGMQIRLVEN